MFAMQIQQVGEKITSKGSQTRTRALYTTAPESEEQLII